VQPRGFAFVTDLRKGRDKAVWLSALFSSDARHRPIHTPFFLYIIGGISFQIALEIFSPTCILHQETMSCYSAMVTMLRILCLLQFIFYMAVGCHVGERIALMRIRSLLVEANSQVPASWGRGDDCCSWERVGCNNGTRVSDLNLGSLYVPLLNSATGGWSWNMNNMTMFSPFHELQLLDLSWSSANFTSFEGTILPSQVPMHALGYISYRTLYQSTRTIHNS
jgi:hypothetical protein